MYGFVNSALEKLIRRRFGEEIWLEIKDRTTMNMDFISNQLYSDGDTEVLIEAAVEILGIDAGSILEMFGEQFLLWCKESGYANMLQLLGRSLTDFLGNLDALHDHLAVIYPSMRAPSFRCTEDPDSHTIYLHYYSVRQGLWSIVGGIVKSVARELHDTEVSVEVIQGEKQIGSMFHSEFKIDNIGTHSVEDVDPQKPRKMKRMASIPYNPKEKDSIPIITQHVFCKAFPFHIIFNRSMNILQLGSSLKKLIGVTREEQFQVTELFTFLRPRLDFTFQNILNHINTIYILNASVSRCSVDLRGQMVYLQDCDCILYLCSPYIKNLDDLKEKGLYLSDIPIHDATRGLIITEGALSSQFQHAMEMEFLLRDKEELVDELEYHKSRMRDLLLEIMPGKTAETLLNGQVVTPQRYECVTILFSDIVGFTRICSQCKAHEVVNMLNELYCYFDQVLIRNRVYKVETIGDAYMVVGGLPEPNRTHAADVCNQALDMMMCSKMVHDPTDPDKNIVIRIGIHSGEVASGVVGFKMPRYCLFGDTVNVTSRAESNSVPGKINVTEWTYVHLKDRPNWIFELRGPVEFKNVAKPVMCYWLVENGDRSRETHPPLQHPPEVPSFTDLLQPSTPRRGSLIPTTIDDDIGPLGLSSTDVNALRLLGRPRYDSSTNLDSKSFTPFRSRSSTRSSGDESLYGSIDLGSHRSSVFEEHRSPRLSLAHRISSSSDLPRRSFTSTSLHKMQSLSEHPSEESVSNSSYHGKPSWCSSTAGDNIPEVKPIPEETRMKKYSNASITSEHSGGDSGMEADVGEQKQENSGGKGKRRTGLSMVNQDTNGVNKLTAQFEMIISQNKEKSLKEREFEIRRSFKKKSLSPTST